MVWILSKFGSFMTFCQVLLFITGTVIVAPLASTIHPWNYDDPNHKYYCDYTLVMFSGMQNKILLYKIKHKNYLYFFFNFQQSISLRCGFFLSCMDLHMPWSNASLHELELLSYHDCKNLLQNVRLNYFTKTTYLVLDILLKN